MNEVINKVGNIKKKGKKKKTITKEKTVNIKGQDRKLTWKKTRPFGKRWKLRWKIISNEPA